MLFPEGGIVTVVDKGKWTSGREEYGSSRIITMGVMLVSQNNPVGAQSFSRVNTSFVPINVHGS